MKSYFLLSLLVALNVNAWDGTGHMLVAQIARDRMSSQAVARVDALAAKLDNHGVPYNGVSIACWPDDIKDKKSKSPLQGQFKPWHYIDISCLPTDPDVLGPRPVLTSTTNGEVITALNLCVELIRNHQTNSLVPNEEVALALLIHFAGDIHQPLHTTARYNPNPKPDDKYKDDAGGNGVTVANLADTPWGKNLHTFWDEAYRRYYVNGEVKALPALVESNALGSAEMKDWLKQLAPAAVLHGTRADIISFGPYNVEFDAKSWAMETHQIACDYVYAELREPYGAKDIKLREDYVNDSTRIARRQIVVAGYRLGALLNDLYGR